MQDTLQVLLQNASSELRREIDECELIKPKNAKQAAEIAEKLKFLNGRLIEIAILKHEHGEKPAQMQIVAMINQVLIWLFALNGAALIAIVSGLFEMNLDPVVVSQMQIPAGVFFCGLLSSSMIPVVVMLSSVERPNPLPSVLVGFSAVSFMLGVAFSYFGVVRSAASVAAG